jgi:predicted dehydrogenase
MRTTVPGRRTFLRAAALPLGAAAAQAAAPQPRPGQARVRLAVIGFGQQGGRLAADAARTAGAEVVAAADLYDGRLARARELFGGSFPATRDHRAAIDRRDVDAVIIATPDHWHTPLLQVALAAGKDVFCEAPVIHRPAERAAALQALPANRIVQGGGGALASPIHLSARELVAQGRIGRVVGVRGTWDSNTALAAWQVPFPPDASPETIDYRTFVEPASPAAAELDLHRFFRWRCYRAFGSGLAGARLAPLLTTVHWIAGLPAPVRVTAAGTLQRWRDGREVPDTLMATFQYPDEVTVSVGASLSGYGPREIHIFGTEGALLIRDDELLVEGAPPVEPFEAVGESWPREHRDWFYMMHGMTPQGQVRGAPTAERMQERYEIPAPVVANSGLAEFIDCVRTRRPPRESLELAAGAAAAALAADALAGRDTSGPAER